MTESARRRRPDRRGYAAVLKQLSTSHPTAVKFLREAESNRAQRLKRWLSGLRLRGYEELLSHLPEVEAVYRRNKRLRSIAFLIRRAHDDFVTALEATLSGFHSVAYDAMRDVMEIEFLLRDFYHQPGSIERWLAATPKQRNDSFRPAVLRQRHAQRIGKLPQEMPEARDYRGHSSVLHVTPDTGPFSPRGLASDDPFLADSCFWEIFEHGRRLLFAIHRVRRKVAPHLRSPWGPERGLRRFREAWRATQEFQALFWALLDAAAEESPDSRDDA